MAALKTENEAFRERLEGRLSAKYEKRHERLLLSSVQTLEAMDRAIEAARNTEAAESLVSGVMLVRTQLFRILQDEGLERVSVLGLPFDQRSAETVQRRPVSDPDHHGLVIEELQGGHQLRGHIIRRAKVVVGEFVDEAAAATVIVKSTDEPPVEEPSVAKTEPAVSEAPTPAEPEPEPEPPKTVEPTDAMAEPIAMVEPAAPPPVAEAAPAVSATPTPAEPEPEPEPPTPIEPTAAMAELVALVEPTAPPPVAAEPEPPKPVAPAASMAEPIAMVEPTAPPSVVEAAPAVSEAPTPAEPEPEIEPPTPVEPTVAMPAVDTRDEPVVVENWDEPTHPGTPAAFLGLPAAKPVAPAAPPPPEEGDSASATVVLGEEAAMFVRPPAPAASSRGAAALAAEPTEASRWKAAAQWAQKGPKEQKGSKETQPVPPATREAPVRPATTGYPPPRVRTGPVPRTPPRDRSPVYEEVPTRPAAPAAPPPAARTDPGVAAAGPPGGGRRLPIGLVVMAVAVLIAVAIAWWAFGHRPKPPEVAGQVPPATEPIGGRSAASPLAASPAAVASPPAIEEDVTVVRPSPGAGETLSATPGAGTQVPVPGLPTPAPAAVAPPAATPPPVKAAPATARPTPPPAAPVNPVPALMSQGEQAMAAKRYNEAISKFAEVLKLEPQNAEAAARKLHAQGERASVGRYFFTAVTLSEGKASGGGIKGFDGGSVVKSQCECAVTYEVNPANPRQGEPYTVSIFLRNDSKKDIKPQSITATVTVNGSSSSHPVSLATKEIRRGQKTLVGQLADIWTVGTTSWSMEAAIGAGGNTYRAQLTWELRVPAGQ